MSLRRQKKPPVLCFDRTPIFLGVVIIPLAATFAFASANVMLRSYETHHRGQPTELRVALSDRERQEEQVVSLAGGQEDEAEGRRRLHSPPPVVFADSLVHAVCVRPVAHPRLFSPDITDQSFKRPNSLRGPPNEKPIVG